MQVVVNSLLTEYARDGKGKSILILHGWADSSRGWRNFAAGLAADYDVVVPDLPGFGGTAPPSEAWGLDDYAAFVGDFLKKVRVKPYAIIAHSNGGAIAVRGLASGKLRASKLVLLASAGIRNQYKGRKKVIRLLTKTGKMFTTPLPKSVKKRLRAKVYQTVGSDMLVVERLQDTFKKVVTDDIQADAAELHVPTLLIYGEDDLHAPALYGQVLHNLIDGSKFEVLPGTGHFVHLDKPQQTLKLVQDFFE